MFVGIGQGAGDDTMTATEIDDELSRAFVVGKDGFKEEEWIFGRKMLSAAWEKG